MRAGSNWKACLKTISSRRSLRRTLAARRAGSWPQAAGRLDEITAKLEDLERQASWSKAIVGWYHGAVQQAVRLRDFRREPAWIARRLGIQETQVVAALRYLLRLGHLQEQGGKLIIGPTAQREANGLPRVRLRLDRRGLLAQAPDGDQSGDFAGLTIALDRRRLDEARQALSACQRTLLELSERSAKPDALFTIAIQLFEHKELP